MRRAFIVPVLAGAILSAAAVAGINTWNTNGPYGGLMMSAVVDWRNPNVVYAASFGGGVFKSMNWGQSWSTANIGLTDHQAYSLAMHPTDPLVLYAGTATGVFKSTDGGTTWIDSSTGFSGGETFDLVINPTTPTTMYVTTNGNGVFKSTNGGGNWSPINQGLSDLGICSLAIDPLHPNVLYAGTRFSGVFKSSNNGGMWAPTGTPSSLAVWALAVHPEKPGTVYAGTDDGVYKTIDGGNTWVVVDNDIAWLDVYDIKIDPAAPDTVYATGMGGTYKSVNGTDFDDIGYGMYNPSCMGLALDTRNPGTVYAASWGNGMWRSGNGGGGWVEINTGLSGVIVHSIAISPGAGQTAFAGTVGNLFRTDDGGITWQLIQGIGDNFADVKISPVDPDTVFAGGIYDIIRTEDGGDTWASIRNNLPEGYVESVEVHPASRDTVYVGLDTHGWTPEPVFKSKNGGDTWVAASTGLPSDSVTDLLLVPTAPNVVYAAFWSNGVYKTIDNGQTWAPAGGGLPSLFAMDLAIHPAQPNTLYLATSDGVYRSTNAGGSWLPCNAGLTSLWVESVEVNPQSPSVVYAGTWDGLCVSTDGGTTWSPADPAFNEIVVFDMAFVTQMSQLEYAAAAGGVFTRLMADDALYVQYASSRPGGLDLSLPSQILPAAPLLLAPGPDSFPNVTIANPAIIEIQLPPGAFLSQTLATGDLGDLLLEPYGKLVCPLAVSEYQFNPASGAYEPNDDTSSPADIGRHAVQLFRYMAGESKIWIRLTENPASWTPSTAAKFLGFTLGVGAGCWPPNGASNWGSAGLYQQASTQFIADVRDYDFDSLGAHFPVTIRAFYQSSGADVPNWIYPEVVNLFQCDSTQAQDLSAAAQMGATITDFATADLDLDGREDLLTLDQNNRRVFWSYRRADGSLGSMSWRDLGDFTPVTLDAADVTGDSRPDLLIGDSDGLLRIYDWQDLFMAQKSAGPLPPARTLALAGTPSDSLVQDVNGDGSSDFLYTDQAGNSLNLLLGNAFTSGASYATGSGPVALAGGDFDGDLDLDVAVANTGGNTVSVFRNAGGGSFSRNEYAIAGTQPVDIQSADFDRDGRGDLCLALQGDKSIAVWKAQAGGTFSPGAGQKVYFLNRPSALQAENFDGYHGPDVLVGFADYYKLALCVSDAGGAVAYAYSINTLGDVELDPVNHVTLSEDNVLSVAGGSTLGGISDRTGAAALADQPFNLVHFPRSQDLSFSVVNLDAQPALLNLELYDDTGAYRKSVTASIAAGTQYARYLADPSVLGSDADNSARWARAFITQADTYGLWLANEGDSMTYLDGLKLPDVRDARTCFVLPAGPPAGGFARVLLVNPSLAQAHITVRWMGGGAEKGTLAVNLAGRARRVIEVGTTFPSMGAGDFLFVDSDRPVIGCELFGDAQKLAAVDGLAVPDTPTVLYSPHAAAGNFGVVYESFLTLVNTSTTGYTVALSLYGDSGNLISTVPALAMAARSKQQLNVATLFGLINPTSGYIKVDPLGGFGLTGAITFGESGAGRFLSCLGLVTPGGDDFLVGHLAIGTLGSVAFFTGVSILNPDATAQSVLLTAYDQNGFPQATASVNVPARGRSIFLLDQRMPDLGSIFGGYLIIENQTTPSSGLMVFALFGDQPLNFLSAVNAVPVGE